jgi:hypothetical protein
MPYTIRKLPNKNLYKVSNTQTKKLYGITKDPKKLIKAIEINKHK